MSRQCRLLSLSRSSIYYEPKGESAENLALMRRIDELFLKYPFYGSRQMARQMRREGPAVRIAKLMTIPGVGAICATAVQAFLPSMSAFRSGRDFAAWIGLTPRQHSTGGQARLGRTSKMSQRDIRRLLIIGASTVITWAARKGGRPGSWLERMMVRKPRMLVVVALANKMARMILAIATHETTFKGSASPEPADGG